MKQKNRSTMTQERIDALLRDLPNTAEQQFSDLTAGPHLKAKILLAATEPKKAPARFTLPRWLPAAMCGMAALVLVLAFGPMLDQQPGALITSKPLGEETGAPLIASSLTADLNSSDVSIGSSSNIPGYRSIWAKTSGGSFPLIGVNGKYYRLLTSPRSVDPSLMGSSVGTVAEFTTEPSLSGTDVVLSNVTAFGQPVYEIRGMGDTLVTAEVEGRMRLFQRVSFNGNALRGREKLADTLQIDGRVIAMELSGVGTITDPGKCQQLISTLLDCASYQSSGSVSAKQSLLIEMDNGLVLQMAVKNDRLAACGTWSCPEFFEEFEDACK